MSIENHHATFLAACLVILAAVSVGKAQYSGGSGTQDDPYRIATADDLIALGQTPDDYDKHFVLTGDIDLDPNLPGGTVFDRAVIAPDVDDAESWFQGTPFNGVFDGGGYVVSHLTISGEGYLGLFGQLLPDAEIRNLGVVDVHIVGRESFLGGLAGCSTYYNVVVGAPHDPNGRSSLGGTEWLGAEGILFNCYSTGSIRGDGGIGGLVGRNAIAFTKCYTAVEAAGVRDSVGGLAGLNGGDVTDCHSSSSISGGRLVGGLLGWNRGTVTRCFSTGTVAGAQMVGGLVAHNVALVTDCYSSSSVNGTWDVGGLVGQNDGDYQNGVVTDSYSTGSVGGGDRAGGLIGYNTGSVGHCHSGGAVDGSTAVGGLIGLNNGGVNHCQSSGQVTGVSQAGGLLGYNYYCGDVSQCYATGAVKGDECVGGLAGDNEGHVKQCYSIGAVDGDASSGGLVGHNNMHATEIDCFWDTDASGQSLSAGGTGLTTSQMQTMQTYLGAGWDFVDEIANGTSQVWQMPQGGGYPVLAVFEGYAPPTLLGEGTPDDPYRISDHMELGAMAHYDPYAHYRLDASIDLSGVRWAAPVVWRFGGTFDGNGQAIDKLTMDGLNCMGLFGTLEPTAEVWDLGVGSADVSGISCVGSIAGLNKGLVCRCYAEGTVKGGSSYTGSEAGGLVGYNNYGTVMESFSAGAVSGDSDVGGLVGDNECGTVLNCYSMAQVGGRSTVGGLVGNNDWGGTISNSFSAGAIGAGRSNIGGLVGSNQGRVSTSFWDIDSSGRLGSDGGAALTTADMMNPSVVGLNGLGDNASWVIDAGHDYPRLAWENEGGDAILYPGTEWIVGDGTTDHPYRVETFDHLVMLSKASVLWDRHFLLDADIDLDPNLPGRHVFGQAVMPSFAGSFDGSGHVISNLCIEGRNHLGLFGRLESGANVTRLGLVDANVIGAGSSVGALVGENYYGTVSTCYSTGSISGSGHVGGLVGKNSYGTILTSYSSGSVTGTSPIGGLLGGNSYGTVSTSYSTGPVTGTGYVGGLVGYHERGTVSNSYSSSSVSSAGEVGGLVGMNWEAVIVNSYSIGLVRGGSERKSSPGGLAGRQVGDFSQIKASFWDTGTAGQAASAGGTGKTTAQMQMASTFLDAGWDFVDETANGTEDLWWILEGQDYPRLWWEPIREVAME